MLKLMLSQLHLLPKRRNDLVLPLDLALSLHKFFLRQVELLLELGCLRLRLAQLQSLLSMLVLKFNIQLLLSNDTVIEPLDLIVLGLQLSLLSLKVLRHLV